MSRWGSMIAETVHNVRVQEECYTTMQHATARRWPWVVVGGDGVDDGLVKQLVTTHVHSLHRTYLDAADVARYSDEHLAIVQTYDFVEAGGNVVTP